ncbi:MAG TPA: adenylate kinase [Kiritimatiellia bacterium]|jgi:adenylate kinase
MDAIILLGAPGAGKGTVAEDIREATPYIHVSTGDMLREAVKAGQPLGLEAKKFMDAGELVPDELILQIVKERLGRGSADARYMFDGFPRTINQANLLDQVLAHYTGKVSHVFLLEVPRALLITRLSGRRICKKCGAVYHAVNMPPKVKDVCDHCGGELYQRPDDNETTVANRLDVFEKQTASLIDHYKKKRILVPIDSTDKQATEDKIIAKLGSSRR